jgi:hypothetical protein
MTSAIDELGKFKKEGMEQFFDFPHSRWLSLFNIEVIGKGPLW